MSADLDAWSAVLGDLEVRLAQYWRALSGQASMPGPYDFPESLPPLPAVLGPRARTLLAGQREVEHQVRGRLGVLSELLDGDGPLVSTRRPAYLDARG